MHAQLSMFQAESDITASVRRIKVDKLLKKYTPGNLDTAIGRAMQHAHNSPEETQQRNKRTRLGWAHYNAALRGVRLPLTGLAGECLAEAVECRDAGLKVYEAKYGAEHDANRDA